MQNHILSIILLSSLFPGISIIPETISTQQGKLKSEQKVRTELTAQKEPKEVVPGKGRRNDESKAQTNNSKFVI